MEPTYLKKLPLLVPVRLLGYQAGHHLAAICRSHPAANRPTSGAVCGSPGGRRRRHRRPRLQGPSQRYDVVVYALRKWHLSPAEKSRLVSSKSQKTWHPTAPGNRVPPKECSCSSTSELASCSSASPYA